MTYFPVPTFALTANQDVSFQLALGVVIFLVLCSMFYPPNAGAGEAITSDRAGEERTAIADPEEDYLPREYQKPSPTPAEMEALCRWSGMEMAVAEWQEILYDSHRLHV